MKRLLFVLIFLLISVTAYSAPPSRISTYTTGTTIRSADVTGNEDAIFNYLQGGVDAYSDNTIVNADVNTSAGILASKLDLSSISQNITHSGVLTQSNSASFTAITDLGTVDTAIITAADINSGSFDNITSLTAANDLDIGSWGITAGTVVADISLTAATADINGGTLDGVQIGGTEATGELIVNNASDDADGLGSQGGSGQVLLSAGTGANPTWGNRGRFDFYSSTTTWTAPAGVSRVYLTFCGGGGGGGGGKAGGGANAAGGGGSGACMYNLPYSVTAESEYDVVIGAAGTGGGADTDGVDGGDSYFESSIHAKGGGKGLSYSHGQTGGAGGGDRGTAPGTITGGVYAGDSSQAGADGTDEGGGGGGSPFGNGGAGGQISNGAAATGYSAGGGGGDGDAYSGGNGAGGFMIISYQ